MTTKTLKAIEPCDSFYKNHITFTSALEMEEVTRPLKKIGLSYFTFDRTYKDNSHIRLTNAGKWIEHYYRKKLYDVAIFERDPKLFMDGYVFWSWLNREPVYSAAHAHDIDHGLTITQTQELYCDFFHFGTTCNNFIAPELLINHLSFLYRFIAHFKEKARSLIVQAENDRFILPIRSLSHMNINDLKNEANLSDILAKTEVTRLYLGDDFDNLYLTRREMEVLGMLKNGNKPVEISRKLQLSERTLETHIKNIKTKFKCNTLFELGCVTSKLSIQNIFPFDINLTDDTRR